MNAYCLSGLIHSSPEAPLTYQTYRTTAACLGDYITLSKVVPYKSDYTTFSTVVPHKSDYTTFSTVVPHKSDYVVSPSIRNTYHDPKDLVRASEHSSEKNQPISNMLKPLGSHLGRFK